MTDSNVMASTGTPVGVRNPVEARVARVVYPVAVTGFIAAAVLNAITWLPIDVSGLTGLWIVVFLGVFPVWFPVVLILGREMKALRAASKRPWYRPAPFVGWRAVMVGVPPWVVTLGAAVVVYVAINFGATLSLLPGQPETFAGQYYFNNHGSHIATDLNGYLDGLRYQMRIFTGHPMVFYGVAALTMYGRRSQRERS